MRDILESVDAWLDQGKNVAIATVVKVWGSAPRPPGSKMAISDRGDMAGSVSGGCVEGAVYEQAQEVLASGRPERVSFGVSDDDAWAVGLSCGGTIEIWIEPVSASDPLFAELRRQVIDHGLVARVVALGGSGGGASDEPGGGEQMLVYPDGRRTGTLSGAAEGADAANHDRDSTALEVVALEVVAELWTSFGARWVPSQSLFVEVFGPPPRLVIVGAVHVAAALVRLAQVVGFEVIVVDPRTAFATEERFGHADQLLHEWPDVALEALGIDANTFVVLLSHDLKLDVPALRVALPRARYVGCLGSKKTHQKRLARLVEAGVDEALFARMHNPVGLSIGGRRAEEMAVSILAEIVAVSHGLDARPLPAS